MREKIIRNMFILCIATIAAILVFAISNCGGERTNIHNNEKQSDEIRTTINEHRERNDRAIQELNEAENSINESQQLTEDSENRITHTTNSIQESREIIREIYSRPIPQK